MSNASRQKTLRDKRKEDGLVDVRLDMPTELRERLRIFAGNRNQSMKCVVIKAIEKYIA